MREGRHAAQPPAINSDLAIAEKLTGAWLPCCNVKSRTRRTSLLRGSNLVLLMSALGQKQTFKRRRLMSALPPKADIAACLSARTQ